MINLSPLSFAGNALEPFISAKTIEFHHGRHHQTYVNNLNGLITGTELENKTVEEIMLATYGLSDRLAIFNNAAQVFNHDFYFRSLKPGSGEATGKIKEMIVRDFGSYEKFVEEFKTVATSQFGSGWAWLIEENNTLKIIKTSNADNPVLHGQKPILTIDVWEHAYYLDYQNLRADYVLAVINDLLNWEFALSNLE
jgi:superoxide dismutase, Fe-Mn family